MQEIDHHLVPCADTSVGAAASTPARPPSARPRISREFLEAHRRRRYVDATAEILHEFGRRGATTTNVIRLAGGARNSFYEVFRSIDDCIAYGITLADGELFAGLEELDGEDDWLVAVHSAITTFFEAVAAEPLLAELFLVHSAASRTVAGQEAFATGGGRFKELIARGGRKARNRRPLPPPYLAESFSRSIVALAAARVRGPEVGTLPALATPMATLIGGFYLGPEVVAEALGSTDP